MSEDDDTQVHEEPLAQWAEVQKRVFTQILKLVIKICCWHLIY